MIRIRRVRLDDQGGEDRHAEHQDDQYEPGDGRLWAVGANYKASFGNDGVLYVPITGSADVVPTPVRFRLDGATVAGQALEISAPGAASRAGQGGCLRL